MSALAAYQAFMASQRAKGIDPSTNPRLTQEEQVQYREDVGLTPVGIINSQASNSSPAPDPQPDPQPDPTPAPDPQPDPTPAPSVGTGSTYVDPMSDMGQAIAQAARISYGDTEQTRAAEKAAGIDSPYTASTNNTRSNNNEQPAFQVQAQASPAATFDRGRYDQLIADFYKVEANPDSTPIDKYNSLKLVAEYTAPFEHPRE